MVNARLTVALLNLIVNRILADLVTFQKLSSKTKRCHSNETHEHWNGRQAVPRYLMELYRQRHYNGGRLQREIIKAFFPEGVVEVTKGKPNQVYIFNMESILSSKGIRKATFRVFKKKTMVTHRRKCPRYSASVYSSWSNHYKEQKTNEAKVLVGRLRTRNSMKGQWLEFDITSAVQVLKENRGKKLALRLSVVGKSCIEFQVGDKGRQRPFIITFTAGETSSTQRFLRDLGSAVIDKNVPSLATYVSKRRTTRALNELFCQQGRFRVHFDELKWNSWIIAPRSYWANYCDGTCPRSLTSSFNPTNHAILLNILHYSFDRPVPTASCVPTRLRPLSVVYYNTDRTISLETFPHMTVSSCGCR